MTSPATKARGGPKVRWTRDKIIEALRRYAALYGPDFTAAAFSPSTAKWRDEPEMAERYFAGDPETGAAWPSLNAIKTPFDGSFNAARVAAGLPANRPGPAKTKRPDGAHAPVRDVRHVTRTVYVETEGVKSKRDLARLLFKIARPTEKVQELEDKLTKTKEGAKAKTITKTKTSTKVVRERVPDKAAERRADRAEQSLARLREELAAAREDARKAKSDATRFAAHRERSEAKVYELREERRDLRTAADEARADAQRAEDRAVAAERERDELADREPVVIREASPEQAVLTEAKRARRSAELRAARAERELLDTVSAVTGERRKLSKAELNDLRKRGPAGEALVLRALADLSKAKKTNNRVAMDAALYALASAAVSWKERL